MNEAIIKDFYGYTIVVQQYYKLLRRYTGLIIPFKHEGEQVVVEVMLKLWAERKKFGTEESIRSFLKRQIRIHCSNWLRDKTINR